MKSTPLHQCIPQERVEARFQDYKAELNAAEAETEANRCIHCYAAPCIAACPTAIDIPQFIGRIAGGNPLGAARTILEANILGHSCALSCPTEVLCEGACVYNGFNGKPILIGRLQRFAVEHAYNRNARFFKAGVPTEKRVALVGAGPASLACAHELRRQGHEAVLFEKSSFPGGLNTDGIAPYKMKAGASLREIERIAELGVRIECGKELGRDFTLDELLAQYDAVFVGLGLGPDTRLEATDADHPRIQGALDFIAGLKTRPARDLDWLRDVKAVLVVGGGNTALDAARETKQLGVPQVVMSYRRGEADMSGYRHELKSARQEGVEFRFHSLPVRCDAAQDGLHVKLQKTAVGDKGRVSPTSETMEFRADLVLVATGQSKLEELIPAKLGLTFRDGKLQTDRDGRTGHPRIFAGGDLANGGKEVVNAVAEGKRAAATIGRLLAGGQHHG